MVTLEVFILFAVIGWVITIPRCMGLKDNPDKLAWIIVIVALPVIGAVLYNWFGPRKKE
jgi:hypothetical protein